MSVCVDPRLRHSGTGKGLNDGEEAEEEEKRDDGERSS